MATIVCSNRSLANGTPDIYLVLVEAARLGFFHEVVEPDKLLATAISYARCITPDCNTAYAMSKKALQDSLMRQIHAASTRRSPYLLVAGIAVYRVSERSSGGSVRYHFHLVCFPFSIPVPFNSIAQKLMKLASLS